MTLQQARAAIRAAQNLRRWGHRAATRYAENNQVPPLAVMIASNFEQRRSSRPLTFKPSTSRSHHAQLGQD